MIRFSLSVFLSVLLVSAPLASEGFGRSELSSSLSEQSWTEEPPSTTMPLAYDPEEFRLQMLDFLDEMNSALVRLIQHPTIGANLRSQLNPLEQASPVPAELYDLIKSAGSDDMMLLRDTLALTPAFFTAPGAMNSAISNLPAPEQADSQRGRCGDEYSEDARKSSLVTALNGVEIGLAVAEVVAVVANDVDAIADALSGEPEFVTIPPSPVCKQIPTSSNQIVFVIIAALADMAVQGLELAAAELEYSIDAAEFCINLCAPQGFVDYHRQDTASHLEGRGCDNRDNNCTGGIDEVAEDRFDPIITIDSTLTSQCYRSPVLAETAATLAVKAQDDCVPLSPDPGDDEGELRVMFNYSPFPLCRGVLTAMARDLRGNQSTTSAMMTVDEEGPQITLPPMEECYPTMAAARQAFTDPALGFSIADCTAVETTVRAVEKECVADLELEAVDECGNRGYAEAHVRVDATPPEIDIERLLLPEVDGTICFASREDAEDVVHEATRFSDDCSSTDNLTISTDLEPGSCDIEVTSSALDQCGFASSDSVEVRVDAEPPVVSCSVEQELLWPADLEFVDVGLEINAYDNCDGEEPHIEVFVTSDETTTLLFPVHGSDDPGPDAIIERDAEGNVEQVLLRAQRRGTTAYDGRVYRIRIVATDSCGLSSRTDCYVTVPKGFNEGNLRGTVVNSGQFYDATIVN